MIRSKLSEDFQNRLNDLIKQRDEIAKQKVEIDKEMNEQHMDESMRILIDQQKEFQHQREMKSKLVQMKSQTTPESLLLERYWCH